MTYAKFTEVPTSISNETATVSGAIPSNFDPSLEQENAQLKRENTQLKKQLEVIPKITKLLQESRQETKEAHQELKQLENIIYNSDFSVSERFTAIEMERQRKNPKKADEQGRIHFCQTTASGKTGLDPKTIATNTDMLMRSGFIKDKTTTIKRDGEGNVIKDKKGNPK